MTINPTDLGEALFRVLQTGDRDLAVEVVHQDNHNREASVAPRACSVPGPAGTLASGAWMRSAFSDLRFPVSASVHDGDRVWVRLRMQGTHTGPFVRFHDGRLDQAVPPTGRDIDFEQVHMLDLKDGQVIRHEAVRDDIAMLGQLGVFPPSPAVGLRMLAWKATGRAARAAEAVSAEAARAGTALAHA
ncbi:ester cyclase [Streptomyces sp. NBC_01497]|uniref:ester cyclase n=1 Tax=Streptomyces sp. NBC_01497 TaxID=2903885 RepID=UPI002E3310AB|nr:ester cyclase [Streptomyces sp. NBC_01497]